MEGLTIDDLFTPTAETYAIIAETEKALASLYGSTDKVAAERWLTELQQQPQAWKIPRALLLTTKPVEVKFYGAMTLYNKLTKSWSDIPEHLRGNVGMFIIDFIIRNAGGESLVRTRLCQCLGAYALQTVPNIWANPVTDTIQALVGATSDEIVFEALLALAEEFERSKLTRADKSAVRKAYNSGAPALLAILEKGLKQETPQHVRGKAIKCFSQWVDMSLPLDQMMPHIALVAMAVRDEQLFDDAVDCLVGVFNRSDINKYPKCLNDMVATVLSLSDSIFRTIEEEDEDAANGMVFLLVTVVDCLRPMIVNPESSEQIQCCAQLLTLLLACAEFPDTCMNESVSQSTLSAFGLVSEWIREEFVAGHGFSEGQVAAKKQAIMVAYSPIYVKLLSVLRLKLRYPAEAFGPEWQKDDQQRFLQMRGQYGDTFMLACAVVREECLSELHSLLQAQMHNGTTVWQDIEGILYCVRVVAEHLNLEVDSSESIPRLLEDVLAVPRSNEYVLCQCLRTVGGYADWFKTREGTLTGVLQFIVPYLSDKSNRRLVSDAAAYAFYDICESNAEKMTEYSAEVFSSCISSAFDASLKRDTRIRIITALCCVLSAMQRELCVQYLTEISASTVQWLTILNQQSPEDPNTVRQVALQLQILLKICTHVDFEEESSPPIETHQFNSQPIKSPHPIVGVVQQVAPVICLTAERFNANENIIKDCCDIFNGALRNTSEEFLPFLQPYSNLLLSSYSLKPQAPILASAAILASMYRSGEQAQIIAPMTEELVRQSLVAFNQDLHGNTELVAAFFHAMKRVLNKADPVMLFRLDAMLESVIQCAVASLQLPEIPAIKATCSFLEQLIIKSCDRQAIEKDPIRQRAYGIFMQYLPTINMAVVESIAAYTPRSTMKEPVLVLFTLKRHCPQEFQATLSQAVHESPKTAGVTPDEKTKFLKRIVNARKRTDLVPIANDFSLLARKLG